MVAVAADGAGCEVTAVGAAVDDEAVGEFFDFGAWIFGLVTIVLGLVTLVEARRSDHRALVLGLGVKG